MNKLKRLFILTTCGLFLFSLFMYFALRLIPYKTLTFLENTSLISNPSRGFYRQFDTGNLEGIELLKEEGITLIFLAYDLKGFVDLDISSNKLDELRNAFEQVRVHHLKVIFRAAYGFDDPEEFSDPDDLNQVLSHIAQLRPIFEENKDMILTVQAGFLGQWGEWHHSNLGDNQGKPTPRIMNTLLASLYDAVPLPISIAVRTPSFIRNIDIKNIDISRISFHNDALLSTDSDMGTYDLKDSSRDDELLYIENHDYPNANGGEMPKLSAYTHPSVVLKEFSQLKLTYLNYDYSKAVIDEWKKTIYKRTPFFNVIQQRLGYRWVLKSIKLPKLFNPKDTIQFNLKLYNAGFSAVALPYQAELVVYDDNHWIQTQSFENVNLQELDADETLELKTKINVMTESKFIHIGLRFIEPYPSFVVSNETAIRLANHLTYESGINKIVSYQQDENGKYTLIVE